MNIGPEGAGNFQCKDICNQADENMESLEPLMTSLIKVNEMMIGINSLFL